MSTGITTKQDTFLKLPLTLPNSRLEKKKKKLAMLRMTNRLVSLLLQIFPLLPLLE